MEKTKSKDLLEHLMSLNEMAKVGEFSDGVVFVNSEDHDPPHVHYIKDGKLVAKVEIPINDIKNKSELVVMIEGSAYQDYLLTSLVKWFNQYSNKYGVKGRNWQHALNAGYMVHNK